MDAPQQGSLSWRLSSHPITLLCFLGFRLCKLLFLTPLTHLQLTSLCNSEPPNLPLRPLLQRKLRPHLHHHNNPTRNRLLLSQKHCRKKISRLEMVE